MALRLSLLGGYSLAQVNGERIRLGTRKSWALLALLAQSKTGECPREQLAALLWPRSGEEQARASLRQELAVLRKTLHQDADEVLITRQDAIALRRDMIAIDTIEVEKLAGSGDVARARDLPQLYRGDLVAGLNIRSAPFDDWLWLERQRLRDLVLTALKSVLVHDQADGNAETALATAQSIIEIDPTDEPVHRALMQSLHQLGRRAEALAHYARIEEVMRRELDAGPSAETTRLYDSLRLETAGAASVAPEARTPLREKRDLTIAAVGIANSASADDRLGAEEMADLLEQIHAACQQRIPSFGGRVLGMMGDRCLVVFGYPMVGELDAERAVFAALDLTGQALRPGLQLCCGIASGEMIVRPPDGGPLQPSEVSGSVLTRATTLSHMAAGGQVVVGSHTLALLRHEFKHQRLAELGHGIGAHLIEGEQATPSGFDVSERANTLSAFTGRSRELDRLMTLWETARRGEGSCVSIVGEPGIGKSRLVHSFLRRKGASGMLALQFSGSAHHGNTALFPVIQEILRLLDLEYAADPEAIRTALTAWFDDLGLTSQRDRKQLFAILGAKNGSANGQDVVDPPMGAIVACLHSLSQNQPLVLVFEDLHWMDSSTLQLVQALQAGIETRPIFLIATTRPGPAPPVLDQSASYLIRLDGLSDPQCRALALSLRHGQLDERQLTEIIARSDGIPLFLEELVISQAHGAGVPKQAPARAAIPASLQETLMSRIDRMGSEKEILHIAAVIGRVFSPGLLQRVAGCDDAKFASYLQKLQDQNIVFRIGTGNLARYEFKHALVQETTYNSVLRDLRRDYHRRIAEVLRRGAPDLRPAAPEVIARHLEKGGQLGEALDFLEIAGRQAVAVSAHIEAAQHFRRALALARANNTEGNHDEAVRKFLLLLGPQLLAEQGFASDEVREVYEQARSLSDTDHDQPRISQIMWGIWSNSVVRAQIGTASELGAEFLALAMDTGDRLDTIAGHYMVGVCQFYTGALAAAEGAFDQALKRYDDSLHDDMALRYGVNLGITASAYLAWIQALTGRFDPARRGAAALVQRTERNNHGASAGFAHCFLSAMFNFIGNHTNAQQHARTAMDLSEEQGLAQFRAMANINLGRALDRAGHSQGVTLLKDGINEYVDTGAELARPYAQAWLAEAYMDQGQIALAEQALSVGLEFSARTGEKYFDPVLLRLKAEFSDRFSRRPHDAVATLFEQALTAADLSGARALHVIGAARYAGFLKRIDRSDQARRIARQALGGKPLDGEAPVSASARNILHGIL